MALKISGPAATTGQNAALDNAAQVPLEQLAQLAQAQQAQQAQQAPQKRPAPPARKLDAKGAVPNAQDKGAEQARAQPTQDRLASLLRAAASQAAAVRTGAAVPATRPSATPDPTSSVALAACTATASPTRVAVPSKVFVTTPSAASSQASSAVAGGASQQDFDVSFAAPRLAANFSRRASQLLAKHRRQTPQILAATLPGQRWAKSDLVGFAKTVASVREAAQIETTEVPANTPVKKRRT